MKIAHIVRTTLILILGLILPEGCTKSPFDGGISPEPRQITGRVNFLESKNEGGAYVWLEGVNIGTYTDSSGIFVLELPKGSPTDGSSVGLSGVFKLYFYVANYRINSATVVLRDGRFVYGEGDLTREGELRDTVNMFKILDIKTIVEPRVVRTIYEGPVNVQVTLQATFDSVAVVFPKSVGGLLGGILLRHQETGRVFIDIPDVGADTRETVMIGGEPESRRQVFQLNGSNFRDLFLPVGDYTVVPFFFIQQDGLPPALIQSLGEGVEELTPTYLNIPFRREGGQFRILG